MILQNIKLAIVSIYSAKLRSFLTILGVIIGVSSVVTVLSIGEGVKASVRDQVTQLGTNLVQVNPGQAIDDSEGGSSLLNLASTLGASTLTEKDVETIRSVPGVVLAAPYMLISGILSNTNAKAPGAIIGATTPEFADALSLDTARGRFFDSKENNQKVIVLASGIAKKLFGEEDPIGKTVVLRSTNLVVIGVLEKLEGGIGLGPSLNDAAYLPFETGKVLNNNSANIYEIEIKLDPAANVTQVVQDIRSRLKSNHQGTQDFTVTTAEDQLKIFDQIFGILTTFIAAIAAISLFVGGIGIMNIMLVTVAERTREIGVRKAIGATSSNILSQFLVEAIILSILGGIIGIGLSFLVGKIVGRFSSIDPVIDSWAIIMALSVSLVVGVVFGVAPAIKAARKRPIQALKAL